MVETEGLPDPPADMDAAPARAWRKIVAGHPANYFLASDEPLLRAYVEADHFRAQAYEELRRDGMFLETPKGTKYAHPAHSMMLQQASCMSQLAVKLRLCPSARIARGEKAPKGVGGGRPFDGSESGTHLRSVA